jgi:hypothetical protein
MRKIIQFLLIGILVLSSLGVGAFPLEKTNKQIYLGYANITGNGTTSILEAVAENNLIVGIENKTSHVDFYINYNMNCSGITDSGQIWLTVAINGQNVTPALVMTFNSQNGTLKIEDIEVNKKDSFSFIIEVLYASVIPPYINETRALGAGVVEKAKTTPFDNVWFERLFQRFPNAFPLLRQQMGYQESLSSSLKK